MRRIIKLVVLMSLIMSAAACSSDDTISSVCGTKTSAPRACLTAAPASSEDARVVSVHLVDQYTYGQDATPWAKADVQRKITITEVVPGAYKVLMEDDGKFTSIEGATTPDGNDGDATIASPVTGTVKGGFAAVLTAPAMFASFDPEALGETINNPTMDPRWRYIEAQDMADQLFTENSSLADYPIDWAWTYQKIDERGKAYNQNRFTNDGPHESGNIAN
jgi:hypothetical protein